MLDRGGDSFSSWPVAVKAIPALREQPAATVRPLVREWWERSRTATGATWPDVWPDFCNGWAHVRVPRGEPKMPAIIERARADMGPTLNESEPYTLLVALCRELQRDRGSQPFFLDTGTAAAALGLDPAADRMKVWRWLRLAESEKRIERVSVGRRGRASKYRYVGADLAPVQQTRLEG